MPLPFLENLRRPAAIVDARGVVHRSNEAFGRLARGRPVTLRGIAWECAFGVEAPIAQLRTSRTRGLVQVEVCLANGARARLTLDVVGLGVGGRTRWLVQVVDSPPATIERPTTALQAVPAP